MVRIAVTCNWSVRRGRDRLIHQVHVVLKILIFFWDCGFLSLVWTGCHTESTVRMEGYYYLEFLISSWSSLGWVRLFKLGMLWLCERLRVERLESGEMWVSIVVMMLLFMILRNCRTEIHRLNILLEALQMKLDSGQEEGIDCMICSHTYFRMLVPFPPLHMIAISIIMM
jgi:hypothetical protein